MVTGHGWAGGTVLSGIGAVGRPTEPDRAWGSVMPGPAVYWPITLVVAVALLTGAVRLVVLAVRRWRDRTPPVTRLTSRPGMATHREVRDRMGSGALAARAASLRPAVTDGAVDGAFRPEDFGWCWGLAGNEPVYTSVRDAVVLIGPSGAGKGVYVVIPRILDAPGALIVTSTRPDVLTPTFEVRRRVGPVAVLAADGSVSGLPSVMGWSPIRGCTDGETAQVRAHVLAAGTAAGVENASFWEQHTEAICKTLLHAAALGRRHIDEFWRWTINPDAAREAVEILNTHPAAEPEWGAALNAVITGEPKFRDQVWAGVRAALGGLDVAAVRARFDPARGADFDVVSFLREKGTLYLLAKENDPASRLLAALIADIVRVAKQLADASPGARLDPPLTLMLDEVANFARLPDLPAYISAYGGSGIVTFAVIQDLAQLEATYSRDLAAAILGAATIKVILGGISDADLLRDFMLLTGERDEETWSTSRSGITQHTVSSTIRLRPVLDAGEIRGLAEGTALMLFKGNPPTLIQMTPYYRRPEAAELAADQREWESIIAAQALARAEAAFGSAE